MNEWIPIGGWSFSPRLQRLRRGPEEHRLEAKQAAVLEVLVRRPGDLVTKDEMLALVWPDVHVTEEVLTNAVYQLRRILGDDARRPLYIETIPRRGYRLVASRREKSSSRLRAALAAAAVVLVVLFAGMAAAKLGEDSEASVLMDEAWDELDRAREGSATRARSLFERALEREPDDARALAGRARATTALVAAGELSREIGLAAAERDATRAARADPRAGEAWVALAEIRIAEWDWVAAERLLERALEAGTATADAHAALAELYLLTDRHARAVDHAEQALRLRPDSARVQLTAGFVHTMLRDRDRAAASYRAVLRMDPEHGHAGRQLEKLQAGCPSEAPLDRERLLGAIDELLRKQPLRPAIVAGLFAEAGEREKALEWLIRARDEKDLSLLLVRMDDRWRALRTDPRLEAILAGAAAVPSGS